MDCVLSGGAARGRIWADALYMTMPLLAKAGVQTGHAAYFDHVLQNFAGFDDRLRNSVTGLYHHGYNWHGPGPTPGHWGRANGWVAMAMSESLKAIPAAHPGRDDLLSTYQDFSASLIRWQSPSGMWHQVMTEWSTYPETSGTALILYSLATGVSEGWLPASYATNIRRGSAALATFVTTQGDIRHIAPGTGPQASIDSYRQRGPATNDSHGIGPAMLCLLAPRLLEGAASE